MFNLCESAIDAASFAVLYPEYTAISTSGVTDDRAWIQNFITNDCKIYCGFDADETGDTMANKMIKRYPSIKRLRPSKHDWNGVLQSNSLYAAQTQPSPLYFGPHGSFHLFDKNIWQEDWKRYQQQ